MDKIRVRLSLPVGTCPINVDVTAQWALDQAARRLPHAISRADVLRRAAELAIERGLGAVFVNGQREYGPGEALALLRDGGEPWPVE